MGESSKTKSELLFEQYLISSGITDFRFEREFQETSKKPDYSLTFFGEEILFDVKEFCPTADDLAGGFGVYNPCGPIRKKIEKAREKFKDLENYYCCLVLYNAGKPLVDLDWRYIYAAMLGNLGLRIPFGPNKRLIWEEAEPAFQYDGKVRYEKEGYPPKTRNTTISAILVVDELRIGERRFETARRNRERDLGRSLTSQEFSELIAPFRTKKRNASFSELRVVVSENPYARKPLPRDIFCGHYDERYGYIDAAIGRIFAGVQIKKLEEEEASIELKKTLS